MLNKPIALLLAMLPALSLANDRAIALSPVMAMSWEFVTPGNGARARPTLGVGFWQRASGAKPGVGSVYVATMEYQLPETLPSRVRSASFQFSGRQAQCAGAEPVVIDVYAYPADGKGELADASAGVRVAQMRADCATNPAFNQPIDVTQIVRQLSVPAGIRHIGFNMRKANNRQGPGIFNLSAGKLTVVVADQDVAHRPVSAVSPVAGGTPALGLHDLRGEYAYLGRGVATLTQSGNDIHLRTTWTPFGAGPHGEMRGRLVGNTIEGQWYSLYVNKGWYRWVAQVLPNGDIDFSQSDDPINQNMKRVVLTRTSAALAGPLPQAGTVQADAGSNGLIKALGTVMRNGGSKSARDQAKAEALDGIANLPPTSAGPATAPAAPNQPTQ
jgi:hypothetical protein